MTAGFVERCTVWRYSFPSDDDSGGAQVSGTSVYRDVEIRIQASEPDQMFYNQGLEVIRVYKGLCRPATLLIRECDEIEITYPKSHRNYRQRFRVDGVLESNFHPYDSRAYLILIMSRSQVAHADQ